uniref:DUF6245 family protein n=1 Tax=Nonomuraea sp. CA-251285 TaxID=3240002 RepID=UPI003F4999FA
MTDKTTPPPPTVAALSAALAALGAYAEVPTDAELAEQAAASGGEHVLAAVLANALYGASIGAGMLAEGHMLSRFATEGRTEAGERAMTLGREQVIKASGAEGPGVTGMLHWQAGQIAGPLRGWSKMRDLGPMGNAMAETAWALVLLLQAATVTDPGDARFDTLGETVTEAADLLESAQARLDDLRQAARDLSGYLFPQA